MIRPGILQLIALTAALSACTHLPHDEAIAPPRPTPVAAAGGHVAGPTSIAKGDTPAAQLATSGDHVSLAMDLLGAGKENEARAELGMALGASPKDPTALLLQRQLDTDPAILLGSTMEDYVVQPGDSMSALAGRFLGDPLMFYSLSRYNGLTAPNALRAGRTLKVPARPGAASTASSGGGASAKDPDAAASSPKPGRANALRLEALQHLNTGDVNRAVVLLQEARTLDRADPAIERDLNRALAIQAALQR